MATNICTECSGTGRRPCRNCNDTRVCRACKGSGKCNNCHEKHLFEPKTKPMFSFDPIYSQHCPHCGAGGICWYCGSIGGRCSACAGRGSCYDCAGSSFKCHYCGGTGRRAVPKIPKVHEPKYKPLSMSPQTFIDLINSLPYLKKY